MSSPKLFDYNTSFGVLRTNPLLTGNLKITLDSTGGVWLNSFNANPTLSSQRFKKYQVTGNLPYAKDVYNFFEEGAVPNDIIFEVGKFTDGENKAVDNFDLQYDFFYGSGASTLIDRNYTENFRYFQPLWLRKELPEFFVVFKVPEPLSYPYSTNQETIVVGKEYKLVQDPDSPQTFSISYSIDNFGDPISYVADDMFTGVDNYPTYSVLSGTGKVVEMTELKYQPDVDNVEEFFNSKILPNCSVVATFDLREDTLIGSYIRGIVNDPGFKYNPIDFSLENNTYTYYNGVSIKDGVYTRSGEFYYDYLSSPNSMIQSDFEDYVTSGFSRNGIISPSLLNLEFLFNDQDSDLYTINRYFGFYVSRNDLGEFRLNGDYFYRFKDANNNLNLPKPSRNNTGYYYNNKPQFQSSTGGVRLYYEGASGWIPGSYDVNVNDPQKLYYITDKRDKFYSLKRTENYISSNKTWSNNTPEYAKYGPYYNGDFGITGNTGASTGSLVVFDKSVNLSNFTGADELIGNYAGILPRTRGKANSYVEFLKKLDLPSEVVFKIFWPNGTYSEDSGRYDLIRSGNFSGSVLGWGKGKAYNSGDYHYFNWMDGKKTDFADSFAECVKSIDTSVWDCATSDNSVVIASKSSGYSLNRNFSIVLYEDYDSFNSSYAGVWNGTSAFSLGDIVFYAGKYYEVTESTGIPSATSSSPNNPPNVDSNDWSPYSTFSSEGYVKIGGVDASETNGVVYFSGGTDYPLCRVAFSIDDSDKVKKDYWIEVDEGTGVTGGIGMIESISRYVEDPITSSGTVTGFGGFQDLLVANLSNQKIKIDLGSDSRFKVFDVAKSYSGVFSFFDLKTLDFDLWSSSYGQTPTGEYHRYFDLIPGVSGQIVENAKYLVMKGSVRVDRGLPSERVLGSGSAFIGSSVSIFYDEGIAIDGTPSVVVPAIFTQVFWDNPSTIYDVGSIKFEENLDAFDGFYGIQSIDSDEQVPSDENKGALFEYGKLESEYEYLRENYTQRRANRSKIVPYINKWGYFGGTDARGNSYRLNVSPAFSPTNFSPSFEREIPDPKYLTHEWMLLEGIPPGYPVDKINDQRNYLPGAVDLDLIQSADPSDYLYFSSFFTVDSLDYPSPYNSGDNFTKELFTPFFYNQATGYYDTVFRGVKMSLKRKSNVANPTTDSEKFISNYRGFEDYKFSAVLRVVDETPDTIQSPVSYEFIENTQQKSILFICNIVVNDYRAFNLNDPGPTGAFVDYTLLYSMVDKKKDLQIGVTAGVAGGLQLYGLSDVKLSSALDLSVVSPSSVTETTNPGFIYIIPNQSYDTDLREEINLIYPVGGTGSLGLTGPGSFDVPAISSKYPWPIGRSKNLVSFGPIGTNYEFDIPFAFSSPATVPIGSQSTYRGNPVFQIGGGVNNMAYIMRRISLSQISERVNSESQYISYTTYYWDEDTLSTKSRSNNFLMRLEKPTSFLRNSGLAPIKSYAGPQTLGQTEPTGYRISDGGRSYASDILRYAGSYEPLFDKVIRYKGDKGDTVTGYTAADLSYRNCTFAPEKKDFGLLKNLNYSKVDRGSNILSASEELPSGPVYPLIGQTPIDRKNFSIFLSSWDPGYYNLYSNSTTQTPVAGTRSMRENKSFLGSKMMQTPYLITSYTFITLEISRISGSTDIQLINDNARASVSQIQNIGPSNSNKGVGQLGTAFSSVDLQSVDEGIYPDVEVFWQKDDLNNKLVGSIRLDRILRRYLLNAGIDKVFVDNIISEYGVGDPNSIEDDINAYIDNNIAPIYQGITFDMYVKKTGTDLSSTEILLRGDLINPDRVRHRYYLNDNYRLTRRNSLSYTFELPLEAGSNYSTTFTFQIEKI